jgi:hypothetical protein
MQTSLSVYTNVHPRPLDTLQIRRPSTLAPQHLLNHQLLRPYSGAEGAEATQTKQACYLIRKGETTDWFHGILRLVATKAVYRILPTFMHASAWIDM